MIEETIIHPLPNPLPLAGEGVWKKQRHVDALKARRLRQSQTDAEKVIWNHLKAKRLGGWKFKRQFPIGHYIADFVCIEAKVVIEIDSEQHNESKKDEERTAFITAQGYEVIRFWNNDVMQNMNGVLDTLSLTLSRSRERELKKGS